MRPTAALLIVALGAIASSVEAQSAPPPSWAAGYGTTSLNEWPHLYHGRLGARAAFPFRGSWDFYPGIEIDPDVGFSQAFFDLRVTPFGRRELGSFWYLGGGLALASQSVRTSLLTGLQWPTGSLRPFAEFHLFNGVNGSADLQVGVAVRIS